VLRCVAATGEAKDWLVWHIAAKRALPRAAAVSDSGGAPAAGSPLSENTQRRPAVPHEPRTPRLEPGGAELMARVERAQARPPRQTFEPGTASRSPPLHGDGHNPTAREDDTSELGDGPGTGFSVQQVEEVAGRDDLKPPVRKWEAPGVARKQPPPDRESTRRGGRKHRGGPVDGDHLDWPRMPSGELPEQAPGTGPYVEQPVALARSR
jgi:hypothetical protein